MDCYWLDFDNHKTTLEDGLECIIIDTMALSKVYFCDHPVYHCCTLFQIGEKGLAVIQQRFDEKTKSTWWGEVDPWITDDLYLHPCFKEYFDMRSGMTTNGLYPTVTIRQIMWALKMKPIKRERWETVFDRRDI